MRRDNVFFDQSYADGTSTHPDGMGLLGGGSPPLDHFLPINQEQLSFIERRIKSWHLEGKVSLTLPAPYVETQVVSFIADFDMTAIMGGDEVQMIRNRPNNFVTNPWVFPDVVDLNAGLMKFDMSTTISGSYDDELGDGVQTYGDANTDSEAYIFAAGFANEGSGISPLTGDPVTTHTWTNAPDKLGNILFYIALRGMVYQSAPRIGEFFPDTVLYPNEVRATSVSNRGFGFYDTVLDGIAISGDNPTDLKFSLNEVIDDNYVLLQPTSYWEYRDADDLNPLYDATTGATL